ncbi:hypothetical protein PR202_ga31573 [Eleusine coracana subsp. coracana]|uniref:Uncharacterized protein n=1 Tax=Eleusine coracana subsp. coracana TaxID=191504 RepID=A0AAV5DSN9_ELECO|nr:hypothetical protein PR202_ga31573 [Eleusine coracana subsp. coracana]
MYRLPRPRAMATGSWQATAGMTSLIRQVPLGFLDPEANRFEGGAEAGDLGRCPVFPSSGMDGGTSLERVSREELAADDISPDMFLNIQNKNCFMIVAGI